MNHWNHNSLAIKIQVTEAILRSKCLPAIFEIANKMPMPDDPQGICLAEFHLDGCTMLKRRFQKIVFMTG